MLLFFKYFNNFNMYFLKFRIIFKVMKLEYGFNFIYNVYLVYFI